jgi:radical SAM protein with 4Fe4S-binding SPASM domain
MRIIPYKDFSREFHKKNWQNKKPNVCQFELTFGCGLHCKHCYSDCYNKPRFINKELNTKEVKFILDKVYNRGMLWLCFTGGDPLTREDFLDLYTYAKVKGFIITIFTNAYSLNKRILDYLRENPPFVIEITLNAVTEDLYERISGVKGSFSKVMQGINLILKENLALKIKTQITKDNLNQLPKIKQFIEKLGLKFRPSTFLHSRLNGDLTPAHLRISPQEVLSLNGHKRLSMDDCELLLKTENGSINSPSLEPSRAQSRDRTPNTAIFRCAIGGGDGIHIDPYGNTFPCNCIRKPKVNLLKEDIEGAHKKILSWVRTRNFIDNSKCQSCSIRDSCYNCPGKAGLETGDLEGRIGWFCELAHLSSSIH